LNNKTADQIKLEKLIRAKCEENAFVRSKKSYYAEDGDPSIDEGSDYRLRFSYFDDIQKLKHAFVNYGMLRSVYIYKDLIFVNSTHGGGWEAWTMKRFGDKLLAFESITMELIIESGTESNGKKETFEEYIERLNGLTENQVFFYMCRELTAKELADLPEEWENSTVDTSKYHQAVLHVWEVREESYNKWKAAGGLCQKYQGKFYVA
jgi:hypothetical protein